MKIESYLTPYKLDKPVVEPSGIPGSFDQLAVDCPFVFRHKGKIYMLHVGFDGIGYQTALLTAENDDLTKWRFLGLILPRGGKGRWDSVGRAGTWIMLDDDLYGDREIKKINGKYWLFYHSYPGEGYETGPAEIGVAWTEDESLLTWNFCDQPVYSWRGGSDWEKGGLYKCCCVQKGDKYYMFYNAKNITEGAWTEQTGVAVSDDLLTWERGLSEPVAKVTPGRWDWHFVSDPQVVYDSKLNQWVMFYFGLDHANAREGIAISKDLIHFEKYPEPIIDIGKEGSLDSIHAHKPSVFFHNGVLYHFYCAVRPVKGEAERQKFGNIFRTITIARSKPW